LICSQHIGDRFRLQDEDPRDTHRDPLCGWFQLRVVRFRGEGRRKEGGGSGGEKTRNGGNNCPEQIQAIHEGASSVPKTHVCKRIGTPRKTRSTTCKSTFTDCTIVGTAANSEDESPEISARFRSRSDGNCRAISKNGCRYVQDPHISWGHEAAPDSKRERKVSQSSQKTHTQVVRESSSL